ncbi:LOW QUALITY PROTEIN: Histone acetyltransferase [Gryllus bimaculatus]|nr:LOW QUALITY PROTEIN: Histone acetyltransferase [Gryllus bimaculatus]
MNGIHVNELDIEGNYISVPQMAVSSQAFSAQPGASTFVSMPMTTTAWRPPSPGAGPAASGGGARRRLHPGALRRLHRHNFATNFYIQTGASPPPALAHAGPRPTPTPAPTPPRRPRPRREQSGPGPAPLGPGAAPGPPPQQAQQASRAAGRAAWPSCKQLTNGLEILPPAPMQTHMTPPPAVNLDAAAAAHPHEHDPERRRRAPAAPAPRLLDGTAAGGGGGGRGHAHALHAARPPRQPADADDADDARQLPQTNMNVNNLATTVAPPPPASIATPSRTASRASANSGPTPVGVTMQAAAAASSRVSPNVTINPNLVAAAQYGTALNGYRMAAQQTATGTVTGYITNTAAGFINQAQIPMQMGVMNMAAQTQYQDPAALQRAQQNTMYTTYGYINGSLMQPLNSTMRR